MSVQGSQSPEYVISTPVRKILLHPLRLRIPVPLNGRSHEFALSQAVVECKSTFPSQILSFVHASVQCHKVNPVRSTYDLIFRLSGDVQSIHLIGKIVYKNADDLVKELGPYLFSAESGQLKSNRLEEMHISVNQETGHHHLYLLFQPISYTENKLKSALINNMSHQRLPDFTNPKWSPLATLKVTSVHGGSHYFAVPQLLMISSTTFSDLLKFDQSRQGELVLNDVTANEIKTLLEVTFPGHQTVISKENFSLMQKLSQQYGIAYLSDLCVEFMKN